MNSLFHKSTYKLPILKQNPVCNMPSTMAGWLNDHPSWNQKYFIRSSLSGCNEKTARYVRKKKRVRTAVKKYCDQTQFLWLLSVCSSLKSSWSVHLLFPKFYDLEPLISTTQRYCEHYKQYLADSVYSYNYHKGLYQGSSMTATWKYEFQGVLGSQQESSLVLTPLHSVSED